MFTGLILEVGRVEGIRIQGKTRHITYRAPAAAEKSKIGSSIAVDGVCQTVTAVTSRGFSAVAVDATLRKTTLGNLNPGAAVNIEPALSLGDSLDGHLIQGHVSGMGKIIQIRKEGETRFLHLALPPKIMAQCQPEGSLSVDGASLTIAELGPDRVVINIIPHTWNSISLPFKKPGQKVNIETDPLTRMTEGAGRQGALTMEKMRQWGY